MNAYEVLRYVHHVGSPIAGTVISRDELEMSHNVPSGHLTLQTEFPYPALLGYSELVDDLTLFSPQLIPRIGTHINAVVRNFVDDKLYVSAKPSALSASTILKWQQYYDYIDTLTIGSIITGVVKGVNPFGLWVDIGGPYTALIDFGHTPFNGGAKLPLDRSQWPTVGTQIRCYVSSFRFYNQQIDLIWVPDICKVGKIEVLTSKL